MKSAIFLHQKYQTQNNNRKFNIKHKVPGIQINALFENKKTIRSRHLSQTFAQESGLWSNAFNFRKTADTATDPRTGILSFHAKAGNLLSNSGHGPNIDLEIGYSSIAKADPDGLGYGWSWNLTHFNLQTSQLTTSTGQYFHLQQHDNSQWYPLYHKLKDIHISGDKKTHFIITYTNGLREILNHDGYETALEQQDGWCVHFLYKPGTHLLQFITDDQNHSVLIHYKKNNVIIISRGIIGEPTVVSVNKERGILRSITLPNEQNNTAPGIYIRYLGHLIREVDYPTGLQKLFNYNCTNAMKVNSTEEFVNINPCVVSKETIDPGAGQPSMSVYYQYSQTSANNHNYLAFNSGLAVINDSVTDILFKAPVTYTYRTQINDGLIRDIRTYNKYHLLIDEQKISNRTGKKLSQVHTFFCNTKMNNGCAHTFFDNLPATYTLPLKIVTKLWSDSSVTPAITTETMHYDHLGRIVQHTDIFGRSNKIYYCPKSGDSACPATPPGWLLSALSETITTYPARESKPSPILITVHNYYRKMVNYNNHGYRLVLDHQIQQVGNEYMIKANDYYQDPRNFFTYGLLKKSIITGSIQRPSTLHSIIQHYYYRNDTKNNTKTSYVTVDTGAGKQRQSPLITTSLFTNQLLQSCDSTGKNITSYHYDHWGRLIKTDLAKDTEFAVNKYYQYTVSPQLNQLLITSINGLQQKIVFDGAGRILMHFNEALTDSGKPAPGHWIPLQKMTYDHFGRTAAQYSYIIERSGKIKSLRTTQDYDESSRVVKLYLPDKQIAVTQYDDAHRCVINYQLSRQNRHSVVSVMRANVLYQPVKILLIPGGNKPLSFVTDLCSATDNMIKTVGAKVTTVTYDGFGREISTTDPLGRTVKKHYNSLGQMTDIMNPAGDIAHNVYDLSGHRVQSWIQPASGGRYLLASAEYNSAGDLLWSAGQDGYHTTFTYTDDGKLLSATNPARHTFALQYNKIGLPVTAWMDGKLQLQLQYDPVTTLVKIRSGVTGKTTFTYDADGLIKQLIHSGKNGYPDYQLKWQYDKNRRIVGMTDIGNNEVSATYDTIGRAKKITYHSDNGQSDTLFMLTYDDFSRLKTLHYGSGMERTIIYDYFGHPLTIKDRLIDKLLSAWSFHYDANDNITTLIQQDNLHHYARLHYQYDVLNNLVTMTCTGSSGLPLCPRDTQFSRSGLNHAPVITRQDYTFNPLNRLVSVREILQNLSQQQTLNKTTNYDYYDSSAPLRLQKISTIWNYQSFITHRFSYDITGNMTTDGEGNYIYYNAFNQIVQVTKTNGQHSHYFYDSSGREVKTDSKFGTCYLFYRGTEVINEKISTAGQDSHITGFLGVAKTTDGLISQYNESDYKGDISGILTKAQKTSAKYQLTQRNIYSPYGMVFHCKNISNLPLYQQTLHGFDGELTDPATGWQFLGNGHRTYNPEQRYFVSEDPAGSGYSFGSNNPIMNVDPDGNIPRWTGCIFKWMSYLSTFGLSALHGKWAHIAGAVITSGLTVATLGASAAFYGGTVLASAVAAGTAAIGSISVIAAAIPANHGLNMAASIEGFIEMGAMITTAAVDAGLFFATALARSNEYELNILNMLKVAAIYPEETTYHQGLPLEVLRKQIKDLLDEKRQTLNMNKYNDVERVWKAFKSETNDLITCDVATLCLVSWITKKPLKLQDVRKFLRLKLKAYEFNDEIITKGFKMEERYWKDIEGAKEYQLYLMASRYRLAFSKVLRQFGTKYTYHMLKKENYIDNLAFDTFLKQPGMAVVETRHHTTIVEKFIGADNWGVYTFNRDGTINFEKGSLEMIKENYSPGSSISVSEAKIIAYMYLSEST